MQFNLALILLIFFRLVSFIIASFYLLLFHSVFFCHFYVILLAFHIFI
jgi:hypothetical protein